MQLKEENQNRNYPLIINTLQFYYYENLFLNVKENEPIFLYFNNGFKSIKLIYQFKNIIINNNQPIIVSFFIKEKINFKIEISDQKKIILQIELLIIKKILSLNQILIKLILFLLLQIKKI